MLTVSASVYKLPLTFQVLSKDGSVSSGEQRAGTPDSSGGSASTPCKPTPTPASLGAYRGFAPSAWTLSYSERKESNVFPREHLIPNTRFSSARER